MHRSAQIEEIFHEALQCDPALRDAYLHRACGSDAALHREVADLLMHHEQGVGVEPWAAAAAAQLIASRVSLTPGQMLGPYRIESFIAAGGMGQVYRATDERLEREVALKMCASRFSERFDQEARVVASLNHPHICHLYDVGPNYLVMELVEGTPLRGPLPVKQALEYAGQILDALNTAHRKGITHRDLKPANILVTKQGVKLLDFGLATRDQPLEKGDSTLTGKGEILGTLPYMSPEQLQGEDTDARSDLFSFGCVLYEMLTGKRAFDGQSAASVTAAILERGAPSLDAAPPLERVIQTCLAKDPDHRFQNALDVKTALTWAVEPPIAGKTNRHAVIAAAAATLVLGVAGGWALSRFAQPATDKPVLRLQIEPPPGGRFVLGGTNFEDLAISPDGRMAAYSASLNGKSGLWVRPLDGGVARPLAGTETAGQPFWSPDSRSIAFNDALNKLRRVNLEGGAPVEIGAAIAMRGASWGSDGSILFSALAPASGTYGVYRISASGGTASLVTAPELSRGELAFRWPQVLPDGRFVFVVESSKPEGTGVYASSLSTPGERVKLLTTDSKAVYALDADSNGYLLWMRGATLVAQALAPLPLRLIGEPQVIVEGAQRDVPQRYACCRVRHRAAALWRLWRGDAALLVGQSGESGRGRGTAARWSAHVPALTRRTAGRRSAPDGRRARSLVVGRGARRHHSIHFRPYRQHAARMVPGRTNGPVYAPWLRGPLAQASEWQRRRSRRGPAVQRPAATRLVRQRPVGSGPGNEARHEVRHLETGRDTGWDIAGGRGTHALLAHTIQRIDGPLLAGAESSLGGVRVGRVRTARDLHRHLPCAARQETGFDGRWPVSSVGVGRPRVVLRLARECVDGCDSEAWSGHGRTLCSSRAVHVASAGQCRRRHV